MDRDLRSESDQAPAPLSVARRGDDEQRVVELGHQPLELRALGRHGRPPTPSRARRLAPDRVRAAHLGVARLRGKRRSLASPADAARASCQRARVHGGARFARLGDRQGGTG